MSRAIQRALVSVFDKTGIVPFARVLHEEFGIELISTGGTARALQEAGIPVRMVESVTSFPELLDGRVKTLHPRIHAGILADHDNPDHMAQLADHEIAPIDMLVVNLYPFEDTIARPDCSFADAIEMIDIGGPCMLRAACKNHRHVLVVSDPQRYDAVLEKLRDTGGRLDGGDWQRQAALSGFDTTAGYDSTVSQWLSTVGDGAEIQRLRLKTQASLRYGENPHQQGELVQVDQPSWLPVGELGDDNAQVAMSFNNYVDANAAIGLCSELAEFGAALESSVVVCFIKHTNACGVGAAGTFAEAYQRAYLGDPNAAMGGILAINVPVDEAAAELVMNTYQHLGKGAGAGGFFVEVWAAPAFSPAAERIIRTAKSWGERVRLLRVPAIGRSPLAGDRDIKRILGGLLLQDQDLVGLNEGEWRVVSKRPPSADEWRDLRLAWLICKHTKSNAITICADGRLLGSGAGQMSRVMSCRIAKWLAEENGHGEWLTGSVAASDAFFPFTDGPEILMAAGVRAMIQPGGGKRDEEVIAACDAQDVALVMTGTRHFRH
jgi:phosphoribosylaminoimidazolecarboxamide formyltransferase/IMP cyclohydrolase